MADFSWIVGVQYYSSSGRRLCPSRHWSTPLLLDVPNKGLPNGSSPILASVHFGAPDMSYNCAPLVHTVTDPEAHEIIIL